MATIGCGITHKGTKLPDKCRKNKPKQKQKKKNSTDTVRRNHRQILFLKYCKYNTKKV
jgi:hypothetical protein